MLLQNAAAQLLQNAASLLQIAAGITKRGNYYKTGHNIGTVELIGMNGFSFGLI